MAPRVGVVTVCDGLLRVWFKSSTELVGNGCEQSWRLAERTMPF